MGRRGRGRGLRRLRQDERSRVKAREAVIDGMLIYTDIRYVEIM
jgi:hypothetical protein